MKRKLLKSLTVTFCLCGGILMACQAPVFRYALERWAEGTWSIVLLSQGPLSQEQSQSLQKIRNFTTTGGQSPKIQHIDLAAAAPSDRRRWESLLGAKGSDSTPVAIAFYPQPSTAEQPVASLIKLSAATADQVLTSPVRTELAARLSAGHSAVWLFLESGNTKADRDALDQLNIQLQKDEQRLRLPTASELQMTPEQFRRLRIPLKLQFSILCLSRDDPREQFLVDCLLGSEADLRDLSEPMAFPVFGRGRVLYALVGSGIAAETIAAASDFLAGPCSCQVKEQNPGFDLLIMHDWAGTLGEILVSSPVPEETNKNLLPIPPGRGRTAKPMRSMRKAAK